MNDEVASGPRVDATVDGQRSEVEVGRVPILWLEWGRMNGPQLGYDSRLVAGW